MLDFLPIEFLQSLNPYLTTFFLASFPIGELKIAIPVALSVYHLSIAETLFISMMSNIVLAWILIYFLKHIDIIARKFRKLEKALDWIFEHTRKNFFHRHKLVGDIALVVIIALPLPFTGVWTASIAAWLLEIPKYQALIYITVGIILGATFILLMSLGIINGIFHNKLFFL